jgi:diguanylate cyclase (GGDEF)-like protein
MADPGSRETGLREANEELRKLAEEMRLAREHAEARAHELAALSRVALALTNVTDLRASLQMVARELTEVFRTRGSTVTLIDESRQTAEVVAEYFTDPSLPSVIGLPVPLDTPAWKQLAAERRAIVVDRPGEDSILGSVRDVMRERGVSQLLVAPLLSRGVLIGNMSVSHEPGRTFAGHEVLLAQTLSGPVAQAVENARLFTAAQRARETAESISRDLETANRELARLSITDSLTGIPNRRHFHEVVDAEWRRAQRAGESLGLLMVDVDLFKAYNDEYGHQRGDECLAAIATALKDGLHRASDFVARYGGEEFVVVLPDADEAAASGQAHRLCAQVRALKIAHRKSNVAPVVTVSVGYAAVVPGPESLPTTLIASADSALYAAKRLGRDRVSGPPPDPRVRSD